MSRHQRCTSRVSGIPTAVVLALLAALLTLGGATAAWASDPLPAGSVALFKLTNCPEGWQVLPDADGRLILPLDSTGTPGKISGEPLSNLEKRTHNHPLALSFTARGHSLAATSGSKHRGAPGTYGALPPAMTDYVWNELPYIQYLVCVKTAAPVGNLEPGVPTNFLMYTFQTSYPTGCPTGFDADPGARGGRLPVAVPKGGTVDATFGGPATDESQGENQHTHAASGKLELVPYGVAVASGAGRSYATAGTYDFSGTATLRGVGMPYIVLYQCRKM